MRFFGPLVVAVLAAIAWAACWHEVKTLRMQPSLAAQPQAVDEPATGTRRGFAPARAVVDEAERAAEGIEQLKDLLLERDNEISDARDVAEHLDIQDGTPEMDAAIAVATDEIDHQIVDLAGPAAAAELGLFRARVPATVQPVPAYVPAPAPVVVYSPSRAPTVVVAPQVTVVNAPVVPVPSPAYADYSDAPPVDAGYYGIAVGGIGASRRGLRRGQAANLSVASVISQPNFIASAGIPLHGSPLGQIVATNPLLLLREHARGRR